MEQLALQLRIGVLLGSEFVANFKAYSFALPSL